MKKNIYSVLTLTLCVVSRKLEEKCKENKI